MNHTLAQVACFGATFAALSTATASPQDKPIIVFESHVGPRPAKLGPFIHAVNDLLETRGYAAFPSTVLRLAGDKIPQPGILDPDLTAAGLAELHNNAFAKYKAAQWHEALAELTAARDKTQRNPALVANDISNHDLMFRTMVAIADCYKRLGEAKAADEAMRDVQRVYPARPVSRSAAWGPNGEDLYNAVMLKDRGVLRGRLSVGAGDPNAQIAVEGQFRGVGHTSLADLLPGVYHVFIRTSALDPGRQYEVVVRPGEETRFAVDINLDKLLDARAEYVAFTYPSENARKDECRLPSHFSQQWTESGATLVLASGEENGRPIVTGIRCRDGVQLRRAVIFTDTEEATTPAKLVPFLDDITTEAPPSVTRTASQRSASYTVPALMTGGGLALTLAGATLELRVKHPALGAAVEHPSYLASYPGLSLRIAGGAVTLAGLYLLLRHHDTPRPASTLTKGLVASGALVMLGSTAYHIAAPVDDRDELASRPYTFGGFIAGSASLGVGVYRWLRETRDTPRLAAGALGVGAATALSAAFLLASDEDEGSAYVYGPRAEYGLRRTYWDSGLPGVVTGGVAVVALGVGLWGLTHASSTTASTPVITSDGERTMVGWACAF